MKQSEARKHLENLLFVVQKFRSNTQEELSRIDAKPEVIDAILIDTYPWIFGKKSIIIPLEKILENESFEPLAFYNMMYIVSRFQDEVNIFALLFEREEFPEPETRWLMGWEEE